MPTHFQLCDHKHLLNFPMMINSLCQRGIQTLGQTLFWASLGMFLDEITDIFPKLVLYVYHKFLELTPLRLWFPKLNFWKTQCSIKIPNLCKSDALASRLLSLPYHTQVEHLLVSHPLHFLQQRLSSLLLDQSMDKTKKRKSTRWISKYHCDTIKIHDICL